MRLPPDVIIVFIPPDKYVWQQNDTVVHLEMRDAGNGYEQTWCLTCNSFDCDHALQVLEWEVPENAILTLDEDENVIITEPLAECPVCQQPRSVSTDVRCASCQSAHDANSHGN